MDLDTEKIIYDSARRKPHAIEELSALVRYRDLIIQLVRRDLVTRYKRSVLGIAWTMLNPLGTMLILTIVFSQVFGAARNYPLQILTGLTVWNFFSQVSSACLTSMMWGSSLFQHIYLPRTSMVASAVGSGIINFFFSLVPLVVIILLSGAPIYSTILVLPIALLFLTAFTMGVGLILAAYVIYFYDIREIYPIILTGWMYITPIIVPREILGKIAGGLLLTLNPFNYMLILFQKLIIEGKPPTSSEWISAAIISFGTLIAGWVLFTNRADKLAYDA